MKEKRTGRSSVKERADWNRLRSQSDRQIRRAIESDPEARPTDAEFWKKGARGHCGGEANHHDPATRGRVRGLAHRRPREANKPES
jgi:hypothetical protein